MCLTSVIIGITFTIGIVYTIHRCRFVFYDQIIVFFVLIAVTAFLLTYVFTPVLPLVTGLLLLFFIYPEVRAGEGRYESAGGQGYTVFTGPIHILDFGEDAPERETKISRTAFYLLSSVINLSAGVIYYIAFVL